MTDPNLSDLLLSAARPPRLTELPSGPYHVQTEGADTPGQASGAWSRTFRVYRNGEAGGLPLLEVARVSEADDDGKVTTTWNVVSRQDAFSMDDLRASIEE